MRFIHGVLVLLFFPMLSAQAFHNGAFSVGAGYFSQNFFNVVAEKDTGETGFLGTTFYPLNLKYDFKISDEWFMAPQLSYTLMDRTDAGNTATVKLTHLVFQFGKNFGDSGSSVWDWSIGPGLLMYNIKGKGGTTVMNNGTSTATFAIPGGSSTVEKITTNFGTSYSYGPSRFGLDLIFENFFSSKKRTQDLMISYAYQFGGSFR